MTTPSPEKLLFPTLFTTALIVLGLELVDGWHLECDLAVHRCVMGEQPKPSRLLCAVWGD
jgi:hypothetical protein